jgi:predicted RNase H-like nuclease (RuvC/YqgF family)
MGKEQTIEELSDKVHEMFVIAHEIGFDKAMEMGNKRIAELEKELIEANKRIAKLKEVLSNL